MITLDGSTYYTSGKSYDHSQSKVGTTRRTATGDLDRLETGVIGNHYKIVLDCGPSDIATLRASFLKCLTTNNKLNFIDEEGFNWNPADGPNDATHAYNTGVYFSSMGRPQPVTSGVGWSQYNALLVEIALDVNSKNINS